MKKTIMPSMFVLVLFAGATLSVADEPRPSYEHLKTLKWQIGDWRAEFVIEDIPEHANAGAKAVALASHKWIADKAFIQSDFTKLVDGEAVGTGREFTLWNYRTSRMEQAFIVSTQFSGTGVWAPKAISTLSSGAATGRTTLRSRAYLISCMSTTTRTPGWSRT